MKAGETNLVPVSPAERLHDIMERHHHSTGHPPRVIWANRAFRHEFDAWLEQTPHTTITEPCAEQFGPGEFRFNGVLVRCRLDTPHSVLLAAVARQP